MPGPGGCGISLTMGLQMMLPLTGGCNCGAVRYEVTEPLVRASYCHCKRCQRRSGTAASAQAHPAPGAFRIVAGEDALRMWKPPDGGEKWFCGRCGSAIYGSNPSHPESVGIRLGTFDDDPWRSSDGAAVRRVRRPLGADPRGRSAPIRREPPRPRRTPSLDSRDPSLGG